MVLDSNLEGSFKEGFLGYPIGGYVFAGIRGW